MHLIAYPAARPVALAWLALVLAGSGCSIFHRHRSEPPATAVAPTAEPPLPPAAARDLADIMADVLKLRPDQTTRVRQVLNNTVAQVNTARQQHPPQSPALASALAGINRTSESQLRQVLGPEKYKELQARRPQIQAEMQRR